MKTNTVKMRNDLFIQDLAQGYGSTKYYTYFVGGMKVNSKNKVYEAICLNIPKIMRVDKITKRIEPYHYQEKRFMKQHCKKTAENLAEKMGLTYKEAIKKYPRAISKNSVYANARYIILDHCVHCARAEAIFKDNLE